VNITLSIALALQGCIEMVMKGIVGPPSCMLFFTNWEWFFLTFRLEVYLPYVYRLVRGFLVIVQWEKFLNGALSGIEDEDTGREYIKGIKSGPSIVKVALGAGFAVLALMFYSSFPYYPAFLAYAGLFQLLGTLAGLARKKKCMIWISDHWLDLAGLILLAGSGIIGSLFMQRLSADTYLCTSSREVVVGTIFDVSSLGTFVLMILAMMAIASAILCLAGFCMVVPSIVSPDLVYRLWLHQSRQLLGRMLKNGDECYSDFDECYRDLERDFQQKAELSEQRERDTPIDGETVAFLH